jgi:hypothetical protein
MPPTLKTGLPFFPFFAFPWAMLRLSVATDPDKGVKSGHLINARVKCGGRFYEHLKFLDHLADLLAVPEKVAD